MCVSGDVCHTVIRPLIFHCLATFRLILWHKKTEDNNIYRQYILFLDKPTSRTTNSDSIDTDWQSINFKISSKNKDYKVTCWLTLCIVGFRSKTRRHFGTEACYEENNTPKKCTSSSPVNHCDRWASHEAHRQGGHAALCRHSPGTTLCQVKWH